jgi:PAS domain S-box-containing protein
MNALRRRDLEIAHRRLSQSREERRQAIIDMVPIAIFAKDRSGHYVLANTKAEEMARMERGELLGKTDDAFLSPWHAESYTASDGRILAGAAVIEREDTIEYGKRSGSATGRRAEDQELFPPRGVVRVRARQEVELALDQDFEALRP